MARPVGRRAERTPLRRLLARAARRMCPMCGRGRAFTGYYAMRARCSDCGYPFEREEGYWVGALVVNMAVAEIWFAVLFAVIVVVTLPDVAWEPLLAAALVTNGVLPVIFYPYSKTIWMALDIYFHPPASGHAGGSPRRAASER